MNRNFPIDPKSSISIFQQIVNGIEQQILTGMLKEGDYLPSVRELALAQSINPNTVAKAYQILQSLDLVETNRGKGLVVKKYKKRVAESRREELILEKAHELIALGESLRFSIEDLIDTLRKIQRAKK
jgi:GntR family transcriptional regulator